jgi:hypothetical protein
MPRLILLVLLTVMLAACSAAGPYGYGYAVNERPSLAQLSAARGDPDNPFRTGEQTAAAASDAK